MIKTEWTEFLRRKFPGSKKPNLFPKMGLREREKFYKDIQHIWFLKKKKIHVYLV